MSKLFTVAGTSNLNGIVKFRFANSLNRVTVLRKCGHTDIKLIELPQAMNKEDATAYVKSQESISTATPSVKSVITPKTAKTPKVEKAAKAA
jgi:hypothetical protein